MISTIPFSGFYESDHDGLLDRALDSLLSDSRGEVFQGLVEHAWMAVDWRAIHLKYAAAYAEEWLKLHEIEGKFESLHSPREYNFATDRIFVEVPDSEVQRIFSSLSFSELDPVARERFTSRSGFISSYDPNFRTWGPTDEWDHNQVGTLFEAYQQAEGHINHGYESDLMEAYQCNGHFDNWFCEQPKVLRLANIAGHLRQREERQFRYVTT